MTRGAWTGTEVRAAGGALDPQGPAAQAAADLWWLMLILGIAVFVLFAVLLGAGLLRSDREPRADGDTDARRDPERPDPDEPRLVRRWIVAGGVILPTVVIAVVFGATLAAMRHTPPSAPADALTVEIVGHQFWYEVRYPEAGIVTANELHVPVGRPIAIRLTSSDVIHSFWVPALGGKMDLLPDRVNTLVLQADEPGEHVSRCAEFCGLSHANMKMVVVAEHVDAFSSWLEDHGRPSERPTGELATRGRDVFQANCASCHAAPGDGGAVVGAPDLTHLDERRTIAAGMLPNTPENVAAFIRDPASIKPGADMPPAELSDADLDALLAYLGYVR